MKEKIREQIVDPNDLLLILPQGGASAVWEYFYQRTGISVFFIFFC